VEASEDNVIHIGQLAGALSEISVDVHVVVVDEAAEEEGVEAAEAEVEVEVVQVRSEHPRQKKNWILRLIHIRR